MSARLKEKLKERFDERSINNDLWGRKCANQIFLESLISYDHFHNKLAYEITLKKHQAIIEYLLDKYGYTIKTNRKEELQGNLNNIENVIWTFWWQGESMAPEMIKQCIASMKQNSNGHEVIVISEANYMQYIQVPYSSSCSNNHGSPVSPCDAKIYTLSFLIITLVSSSTFSLFSSYS